MFQAAIGLKGRVDWDYASHDTDTDAVTEARP